MTQDELERLMQGFSVADSVSEMPELVEEIPLPAPLVQTFLLEPETPIQPTKLILCGTIVGGKNCAHHKDSHDKNGMCNEAGCDCILYVEKEFDFSEQAIATQQELSSTQEHKARPNNTLLLAELRQILNPTEIVALELTSICTCGDPAYAHADNGTGPCSRGIEAGTRCLCEKFSPDLKINKSSDDRDKTEEEIALEEIAKDYNGTVEEIELFNKFFLSTARSIASCTINEIEEKIKKLSYGIKIASAMQQACHTVKNQKLKDETVVEREERKKKDKEYKAREKQKTDPKVDKFGAIKFTESDREKLIKRLMSKGIAREKAEKLADN